MTLNAIPNAKIFVNNELILVRPNSIKTNLGNAEIEVEAQSAGDGNVETTHSPNLETALGMIQFEIKTTDNHLRQAKNWSLTPGELAVRILIPGGSTITANGASIANNIEADLSSDGYISLDMKSNPLVIS